MFNQKVNYFTNDNPSYLNYSYGAPEIHPEVIHNCGTTINKYDKIEPCGRLPLQTWCSKNVAVESFAMRPIVNSKEYFENIKKYLSDIILNDYQDLKASKLSNEEYELINDYGEEPLNSFLQTIRLDITSKLSNLMAQSSDNVEIFKNYNPICEGFVITDITINSYRSLNNDNHFYQNVIFSAVNTTRYNTIIFKAELYQDTTKMMGNWNTAINDVESSRDVPKGINDVNSKIYVYSINLLNDTKCVVGQEDDCQFKGYNLNNGQFSQLLNDNLLQNPVENLWLQPNSLANSSYDTNGNYDSSGNIKISDSGPDNINNLVKDLGYYYN